MPRLPPAGDRGGVIAKREHLPGTVLRPVDRARGRDRERLNAARQCELVLGLDKQVQVVVLDRHVDDAEPCLAHRDDVERAPHLAQHVAAPQPPNVAARSQHDVHREARHVLGPRVVRGIVRAGEALATGAIARASPRSSGTHRKSTALVRA